MYLIYHIDKSSPQKRRIASPSFVLEKTALTMEGSSLGANACSIKR